MAKRYYLEFGTQISRLRVHWLTGAPLLFLVLDLFVPLPSLSSMFPVPTRKATLVNSGQPWFRFRTI